MRKLLIPLVAGLLLAGCAATELRPDAQRVRLLTSTPNSDCKQLGDVTGGQGNFFTGYYTSNPNLQAGAINDLKNQAAAMGGNALLILSNTAGLNNGTQTTVTATGAVFACKN
jgi:hypothetical protein